MAKHTLIASPENEGFRFELRRTALLGRGQTTVPYEEWTADLHPGLGLLKVLVDNEAATVLAGAVQVEHAAIACMSGSETAVLALPPNCPHVLRLQSEGAISDPAFRLRAYWQNQDGTDMAGLRRTGACLASIAERFLVSEPLYSLLEEVDRLNATVTDQGATMDARMVQFGRLKLALERATGDAHADAYLNRLTIHHATGIAIEARGGGGDFVDPLLYGDVPPPPHAAAEVEETPVVRRPLLHAEHMLKFRSVLFPNHGARGHYRLADGVYVVTDAPVVAALRVVQTVNGADAATRAAFRANPRSFLTQAITDAGGTGDIVCDGDVMREAMEYGERVLGVMEWDGKQSLLKLPVHRQWFPGEDDDAAIYTVPMPGVAQPLVVKGTEVPDLLDTINAAKADGRDRFEHRGRSYPLTEEIASDINKLRGLVAPARTGSGGAADPAQPDPQKSAGKSRVLVLRVAENEEDLLYNARLRDPRGKLARTEDQPLATAPKPHQLTGISWLRQAYLSGVPGVLLADDMGLGKTFQVLAFLHWLRHLDAADRRPVLVVAPKKLLDTWREEVVAHLGPAGLGLPVLAYDEHLRSLRRDSGMDGKLGRQTLDVAALRAAEWVLTTYETLRDYHFSFAAVRFRVAVYDEAQKMKTLATLINHAAKCQQPDFVVLMTGTPIENSVMDLWALLDIAWPGFFGMSGKAFESAYAVAAQPGGRSDLKRRLTEPVTIGGRNCPPVMLRRFKIDVLEGLPAKKEIRHPETMPPAQVRAYDAVIADQRERRAPAMKALQALRRIALHPDLRMPASPAEHDALIAASARFTALFKILDQAHAKRERVLVFVELHLAQRMLCELVQSRYRLSRPPDVINGDTATRKLDEIKTAFQRGTGFDVLLLGPRSAGFGLTLTAANHVVHLNRWWNPAVEDQCSDRVYRMGQQRDVSIHLPIAVHPGLGDASFDLVLDALLSEKRALSREIVVPTAMTDADFQRMFAAMTRSAADGEDLDSLDRMGWRGFEEWAAGQFTRAGFQENMTPRVGDGGADIVLRPPGSARTRPVICQCKHRATGGWTDEQAVRDVIRAQTTYGAKYAWMKDPVLVVVTNGEMSLAARSLAREHDVAIIDRRRVVELPSIAREIFAGRSGSL